VGGVALLARRRSLVMGSMGLATDRPLLTSNTAKRFSLEDDAQTSLTTMICIPAPRPRRSSSLVFVLVSIAMLAGTEARAQFGNSLGEISGSGRYVAYVCFGMCGLDDLNGSWDVFVLDRQTDTRVRVSVDSDGAEHVGNSGGRRDNGDTIDISDDGQVIVFASNARLTPNDTNRCVGSTFDGACQDIYVHVLSTGETSRVSVSSEGAQGDDRSYAPSLSPDGRFVAFVSYATTLVPDDTNGQPDIFLHDRLTHTTTRVSLSRDGVPFNGPSRKPAVANDGIVAFIADAPLLDGPDSLPCRVPEFTIPACSRPYVYVPGIGTRRIQLDGSLPIAVGKPRFGESPRINDLDIDASGRWIVVTGSLHVSLTGFTHDVALYDRLTERTLNIRTDVPDASWARPAISGNGRVIGVFAMGPSILFDRVTGHLTRMPSGCCAWEPVRLSNDGLTVLVENSQMSVYTRDADGDALADDWEAAVGLNPTTAEDAAMDSDGDGLTNLQEFQAGSHPNGTARRYLAEGAANAFFTTRVALFNPTTASTGVVLRFLGGSGEVSSYTTTLAARTRQTLTLTSISNIPANDFSTVIESSAPIVAERTMTWDGAGYGAHAETAGDAPATSWYLAEGATHGPFDLFYLFQNPNTEDAMVTVTYLRPAPRMPVVKTYTVAARSRRTIWVDDEGPELEAEEMAARIESTQPILVERSMYASTPAQPFAAGHAGAGIAAPTLQWFFAEGATGPLFDLFLLVGNPGNAPADVRVTYLRSDAEPIIKSHTVGPAARLTIGVNGEDPRLANTVVSMLVESVNGMPVVAERAMWWPRGQWYEAHLSAGATATGTLWGLADGILDAATETYILIANTNNTAGKATVTFVRGGLASPVTMVVDLPANSRITVRPADLTGFAGGFSAIVESDVPTVVERVTYTTVNGVLWAAGTCALATRLQ
jgi:hypothetical protein